MRTFAQDRYQDATFDWNAFLDNPPLYDSKQHYEARDAANTWVTCAVGNQCASIPRRPGGQPISSELEYLGTRFNDQIGEGEWEDAKTTLVEIEGIAAHLIERGS